MLKIFSSETLYELKNLFRYVEKESLIRLWIIIPVSIFSGFLDIATVAVIGRLTGTLVGTDLINLLPGVKVFGASPYIQSLWLIAIFVLVNWLQSGVRLLLRFMQENLAGELWLDLSGRIFSRHLGQPYEYHLTGNISALASDLLSNLECLLRDILTPALRAISCLISIIFLVAGILYVGGSSAFVLILSMFILYILIGYLINPALRKASRQKIVTRERYTKGFLNLSKQ